MKAQRHSIELLEARIAPATLVSPTVVTYQDVDGDTISIKLSRPIFDVATIGSVLTFSTGGVDGSNTLKQQLQAISLTALASPAASATGVGIGITAKRGAEGDGFVNVGRIEATGIDIGVVKIDGDLGRIIAGNTAAPAAGVASLTVQSLGEFGTSTQPGGGTLGSEIDDGLGALAIKNNIRAATILVTDGGIGKVAIGGSIFGSTVINGNAANAAAISASGKIGSVVIKGNIFGGSAVSSGGIFAGASIASIVVGGSIFGGAVTDSGGIGAQTGIGNVTIGRDLIGGGGDASARFNGGTGLGAIKLGGSMLGGGGEESGSFVTSSFGGKIGAVSIGGDIRGGDGDESAYIHADSMLGAVKITGSVVGGLGPRSAVIYAGNAVSVTSFTVSITVGGSVQGGAGYGSGTLGNSSFAAGSPLSLDIGKVTVKGSLFGGAGNSSGTIFANDLPSVTVGAIIGGSGPGSANIQTTGTLGSLTVKGSIIGGSGNESGSLVLEKLGTAKITGDVRGGTEIYSGRIGVNLDGAKAITIGGSLISGTAGNAGSIDIGGPLGALTIGGSVLGTAAFPAIIFVRGIDSASTPSLGKLTIAGSAQFAKVLGGYSISEATGPNNADAIIGPVSVGGDWIASSIASGIRAGTDGKYATSDDIRGAFSNTAVASAIASITIKGQLLGTVGGTDGFGFTAEKIGPIKIGKVTYPAVTSAAAPLALGTTGDVFARAFPTTV